MAAPSNRLSAHSETQRCVCLCPGEVWLAGREPVALQAWHWSSAHGSGWRSRLPPEAPGLHPAPGRAEPRPSADPAWCRPTPGSCWTRRDPWRSMAVGVREWDAALRRGTATPPSPPHTSSKPAPRSSPPETDHCTDGYQQRLTREIWAGQTTKSQFIHITWGASRTTVISLGLSSQNLSVESFDPCLKLQEKFNTPYL